MLPKTTFTEKPPTPVSTPPPPGSDNVSDNASLSEEVQSEGSNGLKRKLSNRQVQLLSIGGSIGTGLFISIGAGLAKGGPGSLFLVTAFYSLVLALVNNSIAEMNTYMPVSGGFMRLAGAWVDDALGFMAGWNYFLYQALLIPFEIVAMVLVLSFWSEGVTNPGPTAGIIIAVIIAFCVLNFFAVSIFGEAEFWLSTGKIVLIFLLFGFTSVTMLGGNPQRDTYGFRHWTQPAAFLEFHTSGDLGRLEGLVGALATAAFFIVGPDYISMLSGESKHPSKYIKTAYKMVYARFALFFVGGALAVGIVVSPTDKVLHAIHIDGSGGKSAAASPYVIAMENMGISALPHAVNALLLTTIFSAGNSYTWCATRSLYSLAAEGRAPAIFRRCNDKGIPIYSFFFVMLFPLLSFLQLNSSSADALTMLLSLITGGGVINYIVISITFLFYYGACKAQNHDRKSRPYYGYFQPYGAWIALIIQITIVLLYGYTSFMPWNTKNFFSNYTMQLLSPVLFIGWKLIKKTKLVKPEEADLEWERPAINAYEEKMRTLDPPIGFWRDVAQVFGFRRQQATETPEAPA